MDKRIRVNEFCCIGAVRCDFAFSSARTCFIAYGFEDSTLEMEVLRSVLEENGMQAVEAGGELAPAQNAFCVKICSKIITAQFCIVLLNNDVEDDKEIPNANVNMEYGLMLGFNKYVIPFQRKEQTLAFNVAGLDTVKYTNTDFKRRAKKAVEQAVEETTQTAVQAPTVYESVHAFLLVHNALMSPLSSRGENDLFQIGKPLGFNLLTDFAAMNYMFFGNFTYLRREFIIWRVKKLCKIITERRNSFDKRIKLGLADAKEIEVANGIFNKLEIWLLATSPADKLALRKALCENSSALKIRCFSLEDVETALKEPGHDPEHAPETQNAP